MKKKLMLVIGGLGLLVGFGALSGCQTNKANGLTDSKKRDGHAKAKPDAVARGISGKAHVLIKQEPQSQIVGPNGSATFEVGLRPNVTAHYQWRFNDKPINGATSASYTVSQATTNDVGFYSCFVKVLEQQKPLSDELSSPARLSLAVTSMTGNVTLSVAGLNHRVVGGAPSGCPGPYVGFVIYSNDLVSPPTQWFSRPSGTTRCRMTDLSSYPSNVEGVESPSLLSWCSSKQIDFPTKTAPYKYKFTTYFTDSSNQPADGESIVTEIYWYKP